VATQITATGARTRPARRFGILEVAFTAAIAVAILGLAVWSQADSIRSGAADGQAYGAGYPLHGGLAGPSRAGRVASVAQALAGHPAGHYAAGYPLHGGLAGPSATISAGDPAGHYAAGYPLHGGLAGPSRVGSSD
jgi:hypothetical protein